MPLTKNTICPEITRYPEVRRASDSFTVLIQDWDMPSGWRPVAEYVNRSSAWKSVLAHENCHVVSVVYHNIFDGDFEVFRTESSLRLWKKQANID